jgi:glucose/arabinose dehydrogenase
MAVATALVVTLVAASPAATASANTVPGTLGTAAATDVPDAAGPPAFQVVASGLNQPRRVTLGPDGTLLVSEAGLNTVPPGCKDGSQPSA